jgi:hypothetical protein
MDLSERIEETVGGLESKMPTPTPQLLSVLISLCFERLEVLDLIVKACCVGLLLMYHL